jgi:Na+/H+-dicarboxylate symporter
MQLGFGLQCLLALALGAFFGLWGNSAWVYALSPLGEAFLQLLRMLIVPLTFSLIVSSLGSLNGIAHIKKIGGRTLSWFVLTALVAALVGLAVGLFLHPTTGLSSQPLTHPIEQAPEFAKIFLDMVPANLTGQIAHDKIIPLIIFAILFGLALALVKDEAKVVSDFFAGMAKVMFKITRWIIRLSPIGIFVLIAEVTAQYGLSSLLPFVKFILSVYLACLIQLIFYGLLILFVLQINPLRFFRAAWPMMMVAFTTSSSLGTLPVTIDTLVKRIGVPKEIASFVGPLGATMKMDGCGAIYSVIVTIFTAALFNIHLDWQQYGIIVIVATIATLGTAGVPGTAAVTAMVVLSSVNLPYAGLAMMIGIDKIIDMVRTSS